MHQNLLQRSCRLLGQSWAHLHCKKLLNSTAHTVFAYQVLGREILLRSWFRFHLQMYSNQQMCNQCETDRSVLEVLDMHMLKSKMKLYLSIQNRYWS